MSAATLATTTPAADSTLRCTTGWTRSRLDAGDRRMTRLIIG